MRNTPRFIIVALLLAFGWYVQSIWQPATSGQLTIVMIDIGQGDALYIRTPAGNDILIDGGPDRAVLSGLGRYMPPYDHTLEYVIATHDDADHIAGLAELPDVVNVERLLTSGRTKDTGFSEALQQWSTHTSIQAVTRGQIIQIEPNVTLHILHPRASHASPDINDDSVTFLLQYHNATALFTGDISQEIEREIVEYTQAAGISLHSDILKIAHHGSKTSTSPELLAATTPQIALISAGRNNKFDHPHPGPVQRIQQAGIQLWRTDQHGDITCTTTGDDFTCRSHEVR